MQRLGIQRRPEYEGREYEEHGIERCEVTIYVAKSEDFPDIAEAWSMTATGFRFTNPSPVKPYDTCASSTKSPSLVHP
jgi:hypothetical protein